MANLLADPNNWQSWSIYGGYVGPPAEYWDASTSSYYFYGDLYSISEVEMLLASAVSDGDVVSGEFEPLTLTIYGTPPALSVYTSTGDLVDSVTSEIGARVSFSFTAFPGMRLAAALSGAYEYTSESRIYVQQPQPPPTPTCFWTNLVNSTQVCESAGGGIGQPISPVVIGYAYFPDVGEGVGIPLDDAGFEFNADSISITGYYVLSGYVEINGQLNLGGGWGVEPGDTYDPPESGFVDLLSSPVVMINNRFASTPPIVSWYTTEITSSSLGDTGYVGYEVPLLIRLLIDGQLEMWALVHTYM